MAPGDRFWTPGNDGYAPNATNSWDTPVINGNVNLGRGSTNSFINTHMLPSLEKNLQTDGSTSPKASPLEHINLFKEGLDALKPANEDIAVNQFQLWKQAGEALDAAGTKIGEWLNTAKNSQQSLSGHTVQKLVTMINDAAPGVTKLANAAHRMDYLVNIFRTTVGDSRTYFVTSEDSYNQNLKLPDDDPSKDANLKEFDAGARALIHNFYNPMINTVNGNQPDVQATPPQADPSPGGPPTNPLASGGPGPGGGIPSIPQIPNIPSTKTPSTKTPSTDQSSQNGAANAAQQAAQQAGNTAQQAAQAAQQAGQQGAQAAQQALDQLLKGQPGGKDNPEGLLGLGSNGLAGAKPAGGVGVGGGKGGGVGGGAGSGKGLAAANPAARTVAATKLDTPVSRASLSNTGANGAAGSGAPAAGQRGGAGGDKIHKAAKALRHDKHGVIAESDAVVQVIGEEPKEPPPTKTT
ncbi:hypothetical protein [Mycobacteroides salmoniphilum]|uniref:hypothetical protein n=1 Tax=Mycobacteroides salmoniphilum TaxID=404941 RepID=UPI0010AAD9AC|nr:hypothetical protein [Mycobacteroides salmoniphilum]QCH25762.1 hypothetical protein DSM43276_04048 [Mycobacteroides salmoniphilum]